MTKNTSEAWNYLVKLRTETLPGITISIKRKFDINTGDDVPVENIHKSGLIACDIALVEKAVFNEFSDTVSSP